MRSKCLGIKNKTMKHKRQEECGWIRRMYLPEDEGKYLIEDINGKSVAIFKDGVWDKKVKHLLCWTFIPITKIDAPF